MPAQCRCNDGTCFVCERGDRIVYHSDSGGGATYVPKGAPVHALLRFDTVPKREVSVGARCAFCGKRGPTMAWVSESYAARLWAHRACAQQQGPA